MPAGRRPVGIEELVESLAGSPVAQQRLRVILANLAGALSVRDACTALGIEESCFFELKHRTLQRWLEALEPEPAGRRPAAAPAPQQEQIAELEARIKRLELEKSAAELRAELARAGMTRRPALGGARPAVKKRRR
jgi:hypothetical protein